jgi:hypothetical protein
MAKRKTEHDGCLICGGVTKTMTRGLCTAHYLKWLRQMKKLSEIGQQQFEARLIEAGQLSPNKQGQRPEALNPFRDLADQLIAKHPEFEKPRELLHDTAPEDVLKNARRKKKKPE